MEAMQTKTVAEIASQSLAAVRVFEKLGIDYCCGGKRPLADVCEGKGLDASDVQKQLDAALSAAPSTAVDWNQSNLTDLVDHIITVHHDYLRRELPAISTRLEKVYRVYNQRHGPTLTGLPEVFARLKEELELHMRKEEMILFPAIGVYEAAASEGQSLDSLALGSVANPVRAMEAEHEEAGSALAAIREITRNFELPEYACVTYRALMHGLEELEKDLHLHIHLENNILFPRTLQLEAQRRGRE
jgi:regulator of cell morphogenesis and NO signaling